MTAPSTYPTPPEDPVVLAEQALLGALLHQPVHIPGTLDQLAPADLYHPAHQAMLAALAERPAPAQEGHHAWTIAITEAAGRTTRTITPAYTHHLLHICSHPDHAPAYLRIVLGAALRRTLTTSAHRLTDAAEADAVSGTGPDATLTAARTLRTVFHEAVRRWGSNPSPTVSGYRQPASALMTPQTAELESRLLAALLQHPQRLPDITPWITPADLTHPTRQAVYRSVVTLHRNGEPIDPVTVAWHIPHHTPPRHRPSPDELVHLAHSYGGDLHYLAERLLDAALLRTAAATARAIRDASADPARTTDSFLAGAHQDLLHLAGATDRWHAWAEGSSCPAPAGSRGRYASPTAAPVPPGRGQRTQTFRR